MAKKNLFRQSNVRTQYYIDDGPNANLLNRSTAQKLLRYVAWAYGYSRVYLCRMAV